jgi:Cys-tRNA(Pro)/Cys-tRNA(Cys) deacylase
VPDPVDRLRQYIVDHSIQAEILVFSQSTHSVAEAALAAHALPEDFVKNICLIDSLDRLIVAIVKGEDRVDRIKIGSLLGVPSPRLAAPEEILQRSGYPCGGTPSFGFPALFLMDDHVFAKTEVITGGGSETALMRISPLEMQRANRAIRADIRKA